MNRTLILVSTLLVSLFGCHGKQPKPTQYILLLDISGSIYPQEVHREFDDARQLAMQMKRGDEMVIIPIMGNARNDTPGHILRFSISQNRMPFDSDLKAFQKSTDESISAMEAWAIANPAQQTDILGSLRIAEAQFRKESNTEIVIATDFLQEDASTNFATDSRLASPKEARKYADQAAEAYSVCVEGVRIKKQELHSRKIAELSLPRLEAIDAFWSHLLVAH